MFSKTFHLERKERGGRKKGRVTGTESSCLKEKVTTSSFFQNLWGLSVLKNSYTKSISDLTSLG